MSEQSRTEKTFLIVCQAGLLLCLTLGCPMTIRDGIEDNILLFTIVSFLFSTAAWTILIWLGMRRWVMPKKSAKTQWLTSLVVATIIISGITTYFLKTTERRPVLEDEYWDTISNACDGTGVLEAAHYTNVEGIHKAVMVDSDGDSIWYTAYPMAWQPDSIATTELVICIGETDSQSRGSCTYTNGASFKKYKVYRWVYVVAAKTGEEIAKKKFSGDDPKCPGSASVGRSTPESGGDIDLGDLQDWLVQFVER